MSTSHRFSRNGRAPTQYEPTEGEYVKNEVDQKLDRLNELWTKVEKKLLTKEPPRRLWCLYYTSAAEPDCDPDGPVERRFLGIQRHAGKWRVCQATVWGLVSDDQFPWRPVLECDAPTRADAVRGIEELKREVRKTRTIFIPQLDKAISALEGALDNIDD
jgi:hypothetical protein